jgi:hypothetical protein
MSEEILKIGTLKRFHLDLSNLGSPTGTPQITIEQQGSIITSATNMVVRTGTNNEIWYYDYTVPNIAAGQYEAVISYTVGGDTGRSISEFDIVENDIDDIKDTLDSVSAIIIDALGATPGARKIIINIKDTVNNNLEGVSVDIHNSLDDPIAIQTRSTDTDGNTTNINLDDGTYKVRLSKASAIVSETKTITVSADATINLTVTALTITPPASPGVCKIIIYPSKLGFNDVTDANIYVKTLNSLSKVTGLFLDGRIELMKRDTTTAPDHYYIEAVYGATLEFTSTILGLQNHTLVVPSQSVYDISNESWA